MADMAEMGRPKLPPEEVRSKIVAVRLTEADHASLLKIADKQGKTLAEWCHDVVQRAKKSSTKS